VHLSPLDGEIAPCRTKLSDFRRRARCWSPANLSALFADRAEIFSPRVCSTALIVCEDDHWGKIGTPQTPASRQPPRSSPTRQVHRRRGEARANGPRLAPDDVRAAAIYRRHPRAWPKGAMPQPRQSHRGGPRSTTSGGPGRRAEKERNAIEPRDLPCCRCFTSTRLTVVLLSSIRRGQPDLGCTSVSTSNPSCATSKVKRGPLTFPACRRCGSRSADLPDLDKRDLSSLVSCGLGRRAAAGSRVAKIFERRGRHEGLKSGWGHGPRPASPGNRPFRRKGRTDQARSG